MSESGTVVGRYRIGRELGRGGMAVVYLARQVDLDRDVALKRLAGPVSRAPEFAARFLREARIAGGLSHPNIVTVFEYLEHDGVPYIAMECMERGSLRPHVGRLTRPQIAGVLEAVLAALAHAAQRGVVHRDLKPENLMLSSDGTVQVADFGVAKAVNAAGGTFATQEGTTIGTPAYMSPEQAIAREVGPASDLYAAGVIAYELLLGRVPFAGDESPLSVLMAHVNEEPRPPREIDPSITPALESWLLRMLAKDPAARPEGPTEAWHELEEALIPEIGPMWRRSARILDAVPAEPTPRPLTPAPFADPGPTTVPPGPAGDVPSTEVTPAAVPAAGVSSPTEPVRRPGREAGLGGRGALIAIPAALAAAALIAVGVATFTGGREAPSAGVGATAPEPAPATTAPAVTTAPVVATTAPATTAPAVPSTPAAPSVWAASTSSRVFVSDPAGRLTALGGDPLAPLAGIAAQSPRRVGAAAGRVYLLERGRLRILDAGDLSPLGSIPFPDGVAVFAQPEGAVVASASGGGGRVCVIDVATLGPCADLDFTPTGLGAATPRVLVADGATGRLHVLRRTADRLVPVERIRLAPGMTGRVFALDGRTVVPADGGIAIRTGTATRTVDLGERAGDIALVPETGTVWATLPGAGAVAVIDDATGRVVRIRTAADPVSIARWRPDPGLRMRLAVVHADGTVIVLESVSGVRLTTTRVAAPG